MAAAAAVHHSRHVTSLDILLYDLTLHGENYTQLCSRVAYHLPQIKNPGNVALISWSLVSSPSLSIESLQEQLAVIHAIATGVAHKVKVDIPTLSVEDFMTNLIQGGIQSGSIWKQNLILAGICIGLGKNSNPKFHQKLVNGLNKSLDYPQLFSHITLVVGTTFPIMKKSIFEKVNPNRLLIILQQCLFNTGFNHHSLVIFQRANVICQACGSCISRASASTLESVLENIDSFSSQSADYKDDDDNYGKIVLFSLVLLLESYGKRIFSSFSWSIRANGVKWSGKIILILEKLTNLSHIIGTHGFHAYEYVYQVCIDILMSHKRMADSVGHELYSYALNLYNNNNNNLYTLFWLNYCEEWVKIADESTFTTFILPITEKYLDFSVGSGDDDEVEKMMMESAHSIILAALPAHQLVNATRPFLSNTYITCLFKNSRLLSPLQFRLAFRVCVQSLMQGDNRIDLATSSIERLYTHILQESSSSPQFRSIYILTLMDSLPTIPINIFEQWLITCYGLTRVQTSKPDDELSARLWQVISSELDNQRSDIAVRWYLANGYQKRL